MNGDARGGGNHLMMIDDCSAVGQSWKVSPRVEILAELLCKNPARWTFVVHARDWRPPI